MNPRAGLAVIVFLLMAGVSRAADPGLENARRLYESGSYAEARLIYLELADKRGGSGELYYDIGNCYLKEGRSIGKAIYFYEAAKRFIPRDSAVSINLRYARSLTRPQVDVPPAGPFLLRILRGAFEPFNLDEAFVLWNILYFSLSALLVMALFLRPSRSWLLAAALLTGCVLVLLLVPLRWKVRAEERTGIIIQPAVNARLEPFEDSGVKFEVYEGAPVEVLKSTKERYKIKSWDGKVGWVPKGSLWLIGETGAGVD